MSLTAILAVATPAVLGWFQYSQSVQDNAIAQNTAAIENEEIAREIDVDGLHREQNAEKLTTREALNQITTQQAVNAQILKQIAGELERINGERRNGSRQSNK